MNIAHFIWYQGTPPAKYLETINMFQSKNPEFKIYVWNEQTLYPLLNITPIFKNAIEKCEYMIQKIDIYKYVVLYHYGGIYLDLDIRVEAPLSSEFLKDISNDDLVFSKIIMCPFLPIELVNNGIIFAKKKSPLLIKIVEDIQWNQPFYKTKDWRVLDTAGPFYITRWCHKNNIKVIDQKYVEGRPLFYLLDDNYKGLFLTHLHHNSWMDSYLYIGVVLVNYSFYIFLFILFFYVVAYLFKNRLY